MQWIKCSDKMPDKCKEVIIYCEGSSYGGVMLCGNVFIDCFTGYTEFTLGKVSHWMPMPINPKSIK